MIPTRTKRISVYGKRSKRVIDAHPQDLASDVADKPDKIPLILKMKKRENGPGTIKSVTRSKTPSSPRTLSLSKQRAPPGVSPTRNGIKRGMRLAEILAQETTQHPISGLHEREDYNKKSGPKTPSTRMPLSSLSTNVTNSPSSVKVLVRAPKKKASSPGRLVTAKTLSTVQMDIRVVDARGQTIKQEKRTARTDVVVNHAHKPPRTPEVEIVAVRKHHSVSSSSASVDVISVGSSVNESSEHAARGTLSNPIVLNTGSSAASDSEISSLKLQHGRKLKRALANVILSDDDDESGDSDHEDTYLPPDSPPPLVEPSRNLLSQTRKSMMPEVEVVSTSFPNPSGLRVEVVTPPAPHKIQSKPMPRPPSVRNIQLQSDTIPHATPHKTARLPHSKPLIISRPEIMVQEKVPSRYPPTAYGTSYDLISSPPPKIRQLTPIRRGQNKGSTAKNTLFGYGRGVPPSPTTPTDTDLDLSFEFSQLDIGISPEELEALRLHDPDSRSDYPEFLKPLLEECHQETCGPYEFSAFIESFPFDAILQDARKASERDSGEVLRFSKIGEASYSEVFGIGDVVLKVIPLRDESRPGNTSEEVNGEDGPAPSDGRDVRKEIIVTRAMGEVDEGFVKLLKTYIVRGKYPEVLLKLWDEYNERKGSESVRPDTFTPSQTYAIIVLPNDGPDLETYIFSNASKTSWRKASSLFWQVAKALAHAEKLVSFEHRDLHWGQILVKDLQGPIQGAALRPIAHKLNQSRVKDSRVFMDDSDHGVKATIIDLGLSRMDASDGSNKGDVHWTPFDEEVFMGEGDYQFDTYRLMEEYTGGNWKGYHPLTNVMWLHYLAIKLLRHKNLKVPSAPRKPRTLTTTSTSVDPLHILQNIKTTQVNPAPSNVQFTERDCYDSLVDIEDWLGGCIAEVVPCGPRKPRGKGRARKMIAVRPTTVASTMTCSCAGQVVVYGAKRGWIRPALS